MYIININTIILICLLRICCVEGCIIVLYIYIYICIHKFNIVRKRDVMEACSESRGSSSFTDVDIRHIWATSINTIEWAACIHGRLCRPHKPSRHGVTYKNFCVSGMRVPPRPLPSRTSTHHQSCLTLYKLFSCVCFVK
jgi:hypothetical protein